MMKISNALLFWLFALFSVKTCYSQSYSPLGSGFNSLNDVRTICFDSTTNNLYAGGNFSSSGSGVFLNKIARWDGSNWNSLGAGAIGGAVESIQLYDGFIYAAGSISEFGGIVTNGVGKWNGNSWSAVHNFTLNMQTPNVYGMTVSEDDLYVLGGFNFMDTIPAGGVARFDGNVWHQYPPIDPNGYCVTAIKFNNELYVGGNFDGGPGKNDIVKYNGTSWVSVGGGFTGAATWVNDLKVFQNKLYVSGYFNQSNGDPGNNISIWDGTSWSQAGSGCLPSNVMEMIEFQNELYVGGQINEAGGVPVSKFAKWDGSNWFSLGSNFSNTVHCFGKDNSGLYIGGAFITVNGDTMNKITKFDPLVSIIENTVIDFSVVKVHPNPANDILLIDFSLNLNAQRVDLSIYDFTGRKVFSAFANRSFGQSEIDISSIAAGGYQIVIDAGKAGIFMRMLMIVR